MRQIKFRAWSKISCEMFTVVMLAFPFGENRVIVSGRGGSTDTENDDCILMQFTGLLDRHGKEIYEGDILKSEGETKTQPFNFNKEVRDPWWEISEVVFEGGRFGQIVRTQHNSYFGELPSPFRDIFRPEEYKEVIGNIYENPSLLKET